MKKAKKKTKRVLDLLQIFPSRPEWASGWYYRVRSPNGRKENVSEAYHNKGNAKRAAENFAKRHCRPIGFLVQILDRDKSVTKEYTIK